MINDPFLPVTILVSLLLRWVTSRFPYSGAGKPPMFGDYEAQRHWMEIAVNLGTKEWYRNSTENDLLYWGLDYPPLTAYHSYINGQVAKMFNKSWIELRTSRGTESYSHKLFMRSTVFISDMLIFYSSLYFYWCGNKSVINARKKVIAAFITLLYPAYILIDHGHFQYNCISLGFTLWAIFFLEKNQDLLGAIAFVLSLNYKQMSLYHAFPFFFYLLGRCCNQSNFAERFKKLLSICLVVIFTFTICWLPFIFDLDSMFQVFRRLFPFDRGLFEDKVANIWCSLEIIFKFRRFYDISTLAYLSFISTLTLSMPSCVHLLMNPTLRNFKLSLANVSLVFFLFSFQVHEKSILLPALPIGLLIFETPFLTFWFYIISTLSLQPLLIKDGLMIPYFSLMIFFVFIYVQSSGFADHSLVNGGNLAKFKIICFVTSMILSLYLSICTLVVKPPNRYPDFFALANSIFCCGHFILFLAYLYHKQLAESLVKLSHVPSPKEKFTQLKPHSD